MRLARMLNFRTWLKAAVPAHVEVLPLSCAKPTCRDIGVCFSGYRGNSGLPARRRRRSGAAPLEPAARVRDGGLGCLGDGVEKAVRVLDDGEEGSVARAHVAGLDLMGDQVVAG